MVEVLLEGLTFPEGPRWHDGRLWFSDFYNHRVVAVGLDGKAETMATVPEIPSGLGWMPDGTLLVVSMNNRRILRMEGGNLVPHGDLAAIAGGPCNDMVVDAAGRAYVGNFGYERFKGEDARPAKLARVDPDGGVSVVAEDLLFPNGTVITPDGRRLIIGETMGNRLTAFDIDKAERSSTSGNNDVCRAVGLDKRDLCIGHTATVVEHHIAADRNASGGRYRLEPKVERVIVRSRAAGRDRNDRKCSCR